MIDSVDKRELEQSNGKIIVSRKMKIQPSDGGQLADNIILDCLRSVEGREFNQYLELEQPVQKPLEQPVQ